MEFVPVDGRGLHFKRHRSPCRGAYHLEAVGKDVDVVPRRNALRGCRVIRSNASFPKMARKTPISVELELPADAEELVRKLIKCLLLEDAAASKLLRTSDAGACCLLVTAPSTFYNRWSRQESRLAIWGPKPLNVGSTVDVLVDGVVRGRKASIRLIETLEV